MTDATHSTEPRTNRSPWRPLAIIVAVLAMSWFAFPGPVASWVYETCGEAAYCPPLQSVADSVDSFSRNTGIALFFDDARANLRAALGIDFY